MLRGYGGPREDDVELRVVRVIGVQAVVDSGTQLSDVRVRNGQGLERGRQTNSYALMRRAKREIEVGTDSCRLLTSSEEANLYELVPFIQRISP